MATISSETLTAALRLREKSQNYDGIDAAISKAINETSAARNAAGGNAVGEIKAGLESMIGVANNLVENAETISKTVIAKVPLYLYMGTWALVQVIIGCISKWGINTYLYSLI